MNVLFMLPSSASAVCWLILDPEGGIECAIVMLGGAADCWGTVRGSLRMLPGCALGVYAGGGGPWRDGTLDDST